MRLNVYVSDTLAERMKKVRVEVNWSEVAQRAFEQKLGEIAASKIKLTMNDTIERLRASKAKSGSEAKTAGKKAGGDWAKRSAEYEQLRAFAAHREQAGTDWDHAKDQLLIAIPKLVLGSVRGNGVHDFWASIVDKIDFPLWKSGDQGKKDFAEGFFEGVDEIWEDVKDEI